MHSFLSAVFIMFALASQALAFNEIPNFTVITIGKANFTVTDLVNIPDSPVKTACAANLTDTATKLTACATATNCLCSKDTITSLVSSQQCMFTYLVEKNKPPPNLLAGSTPLIGGYLAACTAGNSSDPTVFPLASVGANATIPPASAKLALPADWYGPNSLHLDLPLTVIAVTVGVIFSFGALGILANM